MRADVRDFRQDYDHTDPAFLQDMTDVGRDLRENCPVARGEAFGGFWVLTRYDDVAAAQKDWETFSAAGGVVLPSLGNDVRAIPQESDPPLHKRYRAAVMRFLDRPAVAAREDEIRALVREHVGALLDAGEVDVAAQVAVPLPTTIVARLMGFPAQDVGTLRGLLDRTLALLVAPEDDPEATAATWGELAAFVGGHLAERVAEPRDDFLTALIETQVDGEELTDVERLGLCISVIFAGQDTTTNAMNNLLVRLAEHPDERARLIAEPDLIPSAIEESLRMECPIQHSARTVAQDTEVAGTELAAGDRVVFNLGAANRDPSRFEDADTFVLDRQPNRHLAFGSGLHHCAGIHLARLELRMLFEEILTRAPDYRLVASPQRTLMGGIVLGYPSVLAEFPSAG